MAGRANLGKSMDKVVMNENPKITLRVNYRYSTDISLLPYA